MSVTQRSSSANLEDEQKHHHITSKELTRKFKYYQRRIEGLWRKRQRIEAVLFMSLLVEFFVKEAILNFEKIIEGIVVGAHIGFNPRNLYSKNDIESQPLGYLIRILDTYTKDKDLINNLWKFSRVRNDCVHKLLSREIRDVNMQLKNFNLFFYELMIQLMRLNIDQMDHAEKYFEPICDECFKKMLPRQIKL